MSSTVLTTPTVTPKPTAGSVIDAVLHDVILTGVLAASIFVKNPAHQNTAAQIINAIKQLLPMLDSQLTGQQQQ